MLTPIFYTLPGNESFAPCVAHPGEDAGADIKACVADTYDRREAFIFYKDYLDQVEYAQLRVDGQPFEEHYPSLLESIDNASGAIFLRPGETTLVNSGFKIGFTGEVPKGFVPVYAIVPRSGLAHKHNITVSNSPGIVDSGYRDWVKVSLTNRSKNYHVFTHGARIAQGLIWLVHDQSNCIITTDEDLLLSSSRSESGFGSTGV
jgi:dUTP pyrophosphatase